MSGFEQTAHSLLHNFHQGNSKRYPTHPYQTLTFSLIYHKPRMKQALFQFVEWLSFDKVRHHKQDDPIVTLI